MSREASFDESAYHDQQSLMKRGFDDGMASRDAEIAELKARRTFLEGTVKNILDHINRGNAPERYAGMTDFGISQDRGMTVSSIKRLAEEALR